MDVIRLFGDRRCLNYRGAGTTEATAGKSSSLRGTRRKQDLWPKPGYCSLARTGRCAIVFAALLRDPRVPFRETGFGRCGIAP